MTSTGGINYTTRAQRVFGYAQQEAIARGQRYIGPEHLLMGLLREPDNLACHTLKRLHIPVMELREQAERRMAHASDAEMRPTGEWEVHLTPRTHRILALAYHEAQLLQNDCVGPEHLLLGLVRERAGIPARVLARLGVDLAGAREAVMAEVGGRPVVLTSSSAPYVSEADAVSSLLAALKHDGRSGRPVLGVGWMVMYYFVCFCILMGLFLFQRPQPEDALGYNLGLLVMIAAMRCAYLILNNLITSPRQRQAAQRLAQMQDKRIIGHLVDFCTWPDDTVRQAARAALTQMLPRLKPVEAALLTPDQQGILRGFLQRRHVEADSELQVAILKAYEQIGDERALPAVSALANINPRSRERKRVKEAAEACLPFLQQRRERQHSSQTLLRPTTATSEPQRNVLLRPVQERNETSPNELLRANLGEP
jgi:hypothetical protein